MTYLALTIRLVLNGHNLVLLFMLLSLRSYSQAPLELMDVFELAWVSEPQISPDGQKILYVRNYNDILTDQALSNIWIVNFDGSNNHPITSGRQNDTSPRWSPDSKKILYKSNKEGQTNLYLHRLDNSTVAKLTLDSSISNMRNPVWSPDGQKICFSAFVEKRSKAGLSLPAPPPGAVWAPSPKYINEVTYRFDGTGYLKRGQNQLFILPVSGGAAEQLIFTEYEFNSDYSWSPDSQSILVSAITKDRADFDPINFEIYEISLHQRSIKALTNHRGPDKNPIISPDGTTIAYTSFDDTFQGYQVTNLYVMNRDGSSPRQLINSLDRDIENIQWGSESKNIYFQYDNTGNTHLATTDLSGKVSDLANNVGGLSLDRPYSGGTSSFSKNGRFAFTLSTPNHPSDLAVGTKGIAIINRITSLNDDIFSRKQLGKVEEIWFESTADKRKIQGWIMYPPNFNPGRKYPMILEIHGGPFANYGNRFTLELQLLASKGFVIFFANPRGSTSYGEVFGNLIHHDYPGKDYDDLMSGVDAVIDKGFVDKDQLFVTGGSGGGILTAWIVGHTNRFKAAVISKPITNWYSWILYSDRLGYYSKYWFPGLPWDYADHYMKRSPISYVKNVKTPTLLITGEEDYRTPIAETEQYYSALKTQGIETAMVRIQEAGHDITLKPSNQINKAAYIISWFESHLDR